MKTLLLLRHGKAEDDSPTGDKDRGLTPKGERDAAFIGGRLAARIGVPDWVVASDALRARQTAEIAARAAGFAGEIVFDPAIYDAELEDLRGVIRKLPEGMERVLLVGHNPGTAMLSMELDGEATAPPSVPPATLIALSLDIMRWADSAPQCGRRVAVLKPKDH